jgi:hypothetical protein
MIEAASCTIALPETQAREVVLKSDRLCVTEG